MSYSLKYLLDKLLNLLKFFNFSNFKFQLILIILFIFFYIYGTFTLYRLYRFIIVLIVIIVYSRILIYLDTYLDSSKNLNYIWNLILKMNYKLIINILLIINKWKNPLLFCIVKLEESIYDLLVYINSKYKNKNIWRFYYIILLNLTLINPVKIIYFKYYKIIYNWMQDSIRHLLFKRIYGVLLSVLIFSDIINYIIDLIKDHYIIYIYISLVIVGVLGEIKRIAELLVLHKSILHIYTIRSKVTIVGIILKYLYTKYFKIILDDNQLLIYYNETYYYEILWFYHGVEEIEKMFKFKEYVKFTKLQNIGLLQQNYFLRDFENRPSYIYYSYLLINIDIVYYQMDWLYYDLYFQKLKSKFNERFNSSIKYIFNKDYDEKIKLIRDFENARFKLYLYLLWDFENYLNETDNFDFLNLLYVKEGEMFSYYKFFFNLNKDNINIFKVWNKKEVNIFWDLNKNYKFYEKTYNYTFFNFNFTKEWELYDTIYIDYYFKYLNEIMDTILRDYKNGDDSELEYFKLCIDNWKKEWIEESKLSLSDRNNKRMEKVELAISNLINYHELDKHK